LIDNVEDIPLLDEDLVDQWHSMAAGNEIIQAIYKIEYIHCFPAFPDYRLLISDCTGTFPAQWLARGVSHRGSNDG